MLSSNVCHFNKMQTEAKLNAIIDCLIIYITTTHSMQYWLLATMNCRVFPLKHKKDVVIC